LVAVPGGVSAVLYVEQMPAFLKGTQNVLL